MLTITKPSPNRIDVALSGTLDADAMRAGLDDLIDSAADISAGRMLYTITDFELPTLGAIGVEMTRLPKLFGLLGRFDKCAVICDTDWLRRAAEIEGALFPGIDIRAFPPEDRGAAEAWLASD